MEKAKTGSWLTVIGGVLITIVSARVAYEHSGYVIYDYFIDMPAKYSILINQLVNDIGYFLLLCGIMVLVGASLSFRKDVPLLSGLISLTAGGMSACGGIQLWFIPYPPAAAYLNVEEYAPFFFMGVIISIVGGVVMSATLKPLAKDHIKTKS